jgi:polyhydroxyalkanoate synthesis repressor PhaR
MVEANRLIKKYPNRRLYDTKSSSYITLVDIKKLVLDNEDFDVVDAKSGENLTRNILLQIILDEEACGAPLFNAEVLAQIIRLYGNTMQGMLGNYLESNIKAFSDMQSKLREQARAMYGENASMNQDLWTQFVNFQGPALKIMMNTYVEQSQKLFQKMQESLQEQARKLLSGIPFANFVAAAKEKEEGK